MKVEFGLGIGKKNNQQLWIVTYYMLETLIFKAIKLKLYKTIKL
ncbi:hypothetical protein [Arenibacter sp. 6A1]|nr:hypothetical protein [Arenibacter sp. 6A1]